MPLELWDAGWSLDEIAEIFDVSAKSTQRWEDRLLQASVMADLDALIHEFPALFLDEIADYASIITLPPSDSDVEDVHIHARVPGWQPTPQEVSDAGADLVVLPARKPARFFSGAGNAGGDSDADRRELGRPQRPLHAERVHVIAFESSKIMMAALHLCRVCYVSTTWATCSFEVIYLP
ncbi:hypothetical protein BU15DRAFT_82594 [Melanogaster broomeanus]|nr:hypothetical protein BU15DRAFT_82594 [Melanogaster broomeanus]